MSGLRSVHSIRSRRGGQHNHRTQHRSVNSLPLSYPLLTHPPPPPPSDVRASRASWARASAPASPSALSPPGPLPGEGRDETRAYRPGHRTRGSACRGLMASEGLDTGSAGKKVWLVKVRIPHTFKSWQINTRDACMSCIFRVYKLPISTA